MKLATPTVDRAFIDLDQIDPDEWPTFSKKIQELRPRLYRTVRIPAMTSLDALEKRADTK